MSTPASGPVVDAVTPDQWRAWLEQHAATASEAWVVLPNARSGRAGLTHRQALEEALCFGWIDGLNQRHDDGARRQRFSPRRPTSAWSTVNRELVEQLVSDGRMTPAGQAAIDTARANGMWDLLADAQAGVVPDTLRAALDADPDAAAGWEAMRPSARRAALEALARAKRADTRDRKVAAAVDEARTAARGRPPGDRGRPR